MMDVWCDGCGARVLLWPTDLKGVVNSDRGLIVAYRCGAGHDGAEIIRPSRLATA
jgi:hypothetical protein